MAIKIIKKKIGIGCTMEAQTTVSNSTQCGLFIGECKKYTLFWSDPLLYQAAKFGRLFCPKPRSLRGN